MRTQAGNLGDLLGRVGADVQQQIDQRVRTGEDVIVVPGSYNPIDSTVSVYIGDSLARLIEDPNAQLLMVDHVQLLTIQVGDQYGPRGGEGGILIPRRSGWGLLLEHNGPEAADGANNSPNAPSGERWIAHYNAHGMIDGYFKITNDGAAIGDGLGGYSTIASAIGHGDLASTLAASKTTIGPTTFKSNAAMAWTHVDASLTNSETAFLNNFKTFVAMVTAKNGWNSGAGPAILAALTSTFFASITRAQGSGTVFTKP